MPDLANLLIRVKVSDKGVVKADLADIKQSVRETATAGGELAASFGNSRAPLLQVVYGVRALEDAFIGVVSAANDIAGVGVAGRFQKLSVGLTTLTGSADSAKTLLQELMMQGQQTDFKTEELVGFSRMLLATGSNARTVTRELGAMEDTIAAVGLGTAEVGRLNLALSHMRGMDHPQQRTLNTFAYLGIDLNKIVGAAQNKSLSGGEGREILKGMSGQQAFDTIITGMEKAFGGSAQKQAGTWLGVLQNIGETIGNTMIPTGALLIQVLTPIGKLVLSAAEAFQKFNQATGGAAGLVGIGILLWRSSNLLVGSFRFAVTEVQNLTARITGLAIASRGAASVPGAAANGMYWNPGGGRGFMGGIGPWMIGGAAASIAGNALGSRSTAGTFLQNVGMGASIGAGVGSLFGPGGTAIGGLVGMIGGEIKAFYDRAHRDDDVKASSPQGQIADNTKRAADALESIKGSVIGGGRRSGLIISNLEVEYALHRAIS